MRRAVGDALRADKRVAAVHGEPGEWFIQLATGWHWSEQQGFGTETIDEAWALVRQAEWDPEGFGAEGGHPGK